MPGFLQGLMEIYIGFTPRLIFPYLLILLHRVFVRGDLAPALLMSEFVIGVIRIMAWPWYVTLALRKLLYWLTRRWSWMWNTNMHPANR